MARLKDITFESGSLTGTNGADSAQGTIALDSASAVKGTYSARSDAAGDFVREDVTSSDSLYVSFLIKFTTLPASTQTRVILIRDTLLSTVAGLRVTSAGKVQLRDSGGTQIGSDSSLTISTGTIYRLGVRRTKSTSTNGVLEAYVVADGDAWGSPFASTSADTSSNQGSRVEVGQTTGGTTADLYVDNIRIDDASMPTDDIAGGTTYNQSIDASTSSSVSIVKQINKPLSFTGVSATTIRKAITTTLNFGAGNSVVMVKQAGKILSATVGNVVSEIQKQVNVNISAVVSSAVTTVRNISKTINFTTAANVVISAGLLYNQIISATVSASVNITKSVNKTISAVSTVIATIEKVVTLISHAIGFGRNIDTVAMRTTDSETQSLTGSDSQIIAIDPTDDTTI